jgi:hypothetical protein
MTCARRRIDRIRDKGITKTMLYIFMRDSLSIEEYSILVGRMRNI